MNILRHLPAIHELQKHKRFLEIQNIGKVSDLVLTKWLNEQVDQVRKEILQGQIKAENFHKDQVTTRIFDGLEQQVHIFQQNNLRKVINATGVVLHTNLGRARLGREVIEQITEVAENYSTLEFDLDTGSRGSRHTIVEKYLTELTGAEAAMVVNNNAAAVYLVLKALASGKEVIVSRGELVEIGGSFRISEIMEESHAKLVGVGTTNKTYVKDYEGAITEETALLMKVHKSNFQLVGFTNEVDTDELVKVSQKYALPIYEDLGSGTLLDFQNYNLGDEPTVQEKVKNGIDIISFSGDKLLGGPQAGLIVGKKVFIEQLKSHQLARVLRVDKFTLAALEATLKTYIRGHQIEEIPTLRDILVPKESVLKKAELFVEKLNSLHSGFHSRIEQDKSKVGGGTMPNEELDTYVVSVTHKHYTSLKLAEKLRNGPVPIIVRVRNEAIVLDFRTVTKEELESIIEAFLQIS